MTSAKADCSLTPSLQLLQNLNIKNSIQARRCSRVSVFRAYGIPHEQWSQYTLDHSIPLSPGGAPEDMRNVWPEPKAEARRKDEVEDALLSAACYRHTLTLQAAQAAIARNWTQTPVGLPAVHERRYPEDER